MTKKKVIAEFIFEVEDYEEDEIKKSIEKQIYTDMNHYFQSEDGITHMESVDVKEISDV